jgi:hypothetical protein
MRFGRNYGKACQIQAALYKVACDENASKRDRVLCSREWRELEFAKREWRGIPRMSPHKMSEIAAGKALLARNITPSLASEPSYTELSAEEGAAAAPEAKGETVWEE